MYVVVVENIRRGTLTFDSNKKLSLSDLEKRRPTVGRALAMMRGIRAFSPHQQKTGALNSETPCETEETAPPWEQNRNILSFSESFRKVEVLYSEGGTFNLLSDW